MSPTNPFRPASPTATEVSRLTDPCSTIAQHESSPPRTIQRNDSFGLDEEMPPAYTPSADVYHGESTVEVGPQRPFQQPPRTAHRPSHSTSHSTSHSQSPSWSQPPPRPQSQPQQRPQQPLWVTPTPSPSSSGSNSNSWSVYPGQRYQRRGGGLIGALFDTVRDVVDAASGAHDETRVLQPAQTGIYAAPYTQPSSSGVSQSHYMPPHQGIQRQVSGVPSIQQTPQRQIPDDGSPTRIPTPGHPLLNHGNLLVYPSKDHICVKCKNTGYKNYDPSHPCRKCWEKYGRPYAGALTYTPWSAESSSRISKFQRALPRFTPPQASQLSHAPSVYATRSSYGPPVPPAHYGEHLYVCNPIIGMGEYPPVPHAVPVPPGDPRLGGQLCLKCGGKGTLPLLIIDVRPCSLCGGIGRILRQVR